MLSGQGPGGRGTRPRAAGRPSARTAARRSARPGSRATASRSSGADGATKRTRAPQPRRLSGRATVLALILIALAFAYAYPVRVYLSQQAEISRIQAAQEAQRKRIATLTGDLAKWTDDEYVIAQARRRLHYVRPGEVAYVIVEAPEKPAAGDPTRAKDTGPWYDQMWSNVQAADNPRTR
jgi:cell division protein FtsB